MCKNIVQPGMPHDIMAHAHFMQNILGYKHALTICNTYYFYTAVIVNERTSMLRLRILPILFTYV
jgi:hypothetical protein